MDVIDKIEAQHLQEITSELAWHFSIIPFHRENGTLNLYRDEKLADRQDLNELKAILGLNVKIEYLPGQKIAEALSKYYPRKSGKTITATKVQDVNNPRFVQSLIIDAFNLDASDIHFEPFEKTAKIRLRIDGKLKEQFILDRNDYSSLVNRIKIMSDIDISEKRLPQDGRITLSDQQINIDIRVSSLPTKYGEKIVFRLLNKSNITIDLEKLGFKTHQLDNYRLAFHRPQGIILISGPTGSGKTTTLYATLKELNQPETNILTIEDPVEYTLEGINQTQLRNDIGLTYPVALKTFLRQDPDVIMVGEIRDKETADMAIRAAMTGHLVLSTIHTNSALETISRLTEMGIPGYLISDTLNASMAQRLLRKNCPDCSTAFELKEEDFPFKANTDKILSKVKTHNKGKGCENCLYTGYKGRVAIYELILMNNEIRETLFNSDKVKQSSMPDYEKLGDNALELLINGKTSLEEVLPYLI
ncbi:GspE/PulE family protein [Mangrovivirga cuniculi]|uniref:Type II/IV secretion system protein n=1 Tax=Mangrovivirga cuniculi TaxID=2715131 RepID=A0A4D7JGE5_9BACT|nr:GspE/PulE family protein [Mangrovivirga cuniculi]QCK13767.1 type II/IV secretion system protein [Mangrovivirga cuniculi]